MRSGGDDGPRCHGNRLSDWVDGHDAARVGWRAYNPILAATSVKRDPPGQVDPRQCPPARPSLDNRSLDATTALRARRKPAKMTREPPAGLGCPALQRQNTRCEPSPKPSDTT